MIFDNICKFLAATYSTDIATWLLGETIELTQIQPQELAVEPIRADSLILLKAKKLLLHAEFQTLPEPQIPFRMLDYWTRKFGTLPPNLDAKISRLKIDRLENLAEAILDFSSLADLELWFKKK